VAGTFIAGHFADRASKRAVIYVSCGFAAFAAICFCLTSSNWAARAIGLIFGIGYGAFCAVDWAFATNLMPRGKEGKYMAIFHVAFTVPQVLVLIMGGVMGHYLGYRAVFWTIPFYLAAGMAMISKVREYHEIEAAEVAENRT
jgi:MFS family permease